MGFKVGTATQVEQLGETAKTHLYGYANDVSKKGGLWGALMRPAGPLLAMGSGVITLAMRVGSVGEAGLKAGANITLAPFVESCRVTTGLNQIVFDLLPSAVLLLLSPFQVIIGGVITTAGMLVIPADYSRARFSFHQSRKEELGATELEKREPRYTQVEVIDDGEYYDSSIAG